MPSFQEQQMFSMVRELCKLNGTAIYKIAKDCNISFILVAKLYMQIMQKILDDTENEMKKQGLDE